MTRKKLPAYGAQLRDRARREEVPPLCVHLIYGYQWRAEVLCGWSGIMGAHPILALKPDEYAPDVYDFTLLTGLQVCVFDQEAFAGLYDESVELSKRFWQLLGELGAVAADIEIHSPALPDVGHAFLIAGDMARSAGQWPFWWPQSTEEKNAERRVRWVHAVGQLAGSRSRPALEPA